ncbi:MULTISPECIES: hypothetical protein [Candidatus Nitrosocaldus]|uniref:Uncharacterized protein n=1 Tax=Candidatus Nitrosocaldus cavascurensis TaxID=2058097 RepID=A0A2K5ASQ7_9ARCH|nr:MULTISPECIES: hypothetical protein [Candidatus Nitrosocaldus]SPC34657.1 protein of unknown function [Candidatus Nitrosocaldus cavascurensis]
MSSRVRCYICDGIAIDHCSICKRPVCSICMGDDGVCKRCALIYDVDDDDEHDIAMMRDGRSSSSDSKDVFRIGYTALRDVVDIPMLIVGISIIIVGMLLISYASMSVSQMQGQGEGLNGATDAGRGGGGIVVIFPFPFVVLVPDAGILALVLLLVILVPFVLFFLLMRRGLRIS